MHGIMSLLDEQHYRLVEQMWAEMQGSLGVKGISMTPYPHFSYQGATHYDFDRVEAVLRKFAEQSRPFQVRTAGIGIFPGARPVVYIAVVKSPELMQIHQRLWAALEGCGTGVSAYYHPDNWMPHITVGYGDIDQEGLGRVVGYLNSRPLHWEMTIDNVGIIESGRAPHGLRATFKM